LGDGIADILRAGGVARPAWEARQILAAQGDAVELARRRAGGEPLAYVLGEWDFYGLTLTITPDVLIPRPETELLVDEALAFLRRGRPGPACVLDLCCGSGCVGLAIGANHPSVSVLSGDVSEAALGVAKGNGCQNILRADALAPPDQSLWGRFDALVCNPPYIAEGEELDKSVRDYEPRLALIGGADGLDFYRSLLPGWLRVLRDGGLFAAEVGYRQGGAVRRMAEDAGLKEVAVVSDAAGIGRVVRGVQ
jgi:release factor glutamine methyltransferase